MNERHTLEFWLRVERERSPFLDEGEIRAIAEIKLMMVKEHDEIQETI